MKKNDRIKQFVFVLFFITTAAFTAKAQYNYGVTLNYAIAIDDLAKGVQNGYGATFHACYNFDEYVSGGINVGYVTFANKNSDSKVSPLIDGNSLNIIPVTASIKVYIASADDKPGAKQPSDNMCRPYFGLDFGWARGNVKLQTGSKDFVVIAPQFGLDFKISEQFKLRFSALDNVLIYNRLPGGSDILSYVGINVGGMYKF